jgi:hypothetical protein
MNVGALEMAIGIESGSFRCLRVSRAARSALGISYGCYRGYSLGSGRGGRTQGYGHRFSEFVGSNLLQKPVYQKPGRSPDKVEPTGRRNKHR